MGRSTATRCSSAASCCSAAARRTSSAASGSSSPARSCSRVAQPAQRPRARTPSSSIAFRALQGLGGALVSPAALSIITTTFAEGPERTKALGVWSAIAAGGGAFGLLLGGILIETLTLGVDLLRQRAGRRRSRRVLSARLITESKAERAGAFDVARRGARDRRPDGARLRDRQAPSSSAGAPAARSGWPRSRIALLAVFVLIESRIDGPLVRLASSRSAASRSANLVLLLVAGGLFALFFFATLYVQRDPGLHADQGRLRVPAGDGRSSASARAPRRSCVKRLGVRANTLVGMVIAAVGLFLLSRVPVDGAYWTDLLPGLVLMAFGMGNTFVPITLIATTNVDEHDAGPGVGPVQHVPAGGRRARPRRALARSRPTRRRATSQGLGHQPGPQERGGGAGGGLPGRLHVSGDPGHGRGDPARPPAPSVATSRT